MLQRVVLIGLAGALGTLARYGLGGMVQRLSGGGLPWGTLFVNVLGCFLFGVVWTLSDERLVISEETRVIMLGGFMGAFTTFSTFIFDTGGFLRDEQYALATGNILVQTAVGLLVVFRRRDRGAVGLAVKIGRVTLPRDSLRGKERDSAGAAHYAPTKRIHREVWKKQHARDQSRCRP